MTRSSHNQAKKQIPSNETMVREAELTGDGGVRLSALEVRAHELLRNFGIPAKVFAFELKISERYVQLMANGLKPIQAWMILQIIKIGECEIFKQREAIDLYIKHALEAQFGRV